MQVRDSIIANGTKANLKSTYFSDVKGLVSRPEPVALFISLLDNECQFFRVLLALRARSISSANTLQQAKL